MTRAVTSVLIVGGGAAGLLAALAIKRAHPNLEVELVRSARIGTIGVGEGTTATAPGFLHRTLGIARKEFVAEVTPTTKYGIRFLWGNRPYYDFTFDDQLGHLPDDDLGSGLPAFDLTDGRDWTGVSLQSELMSRNVVDPLLRRRYGYHFRADRFVGFLERCVATRDVQLIDDALVGSEHGDVGLTAVHFESGRRRTADLYVDATGFGSHLLHGGLGEPFVSMRSSLRCDRALAGVWKRTDEPLQPYTTAETMQAGWCWRIEHYDSIARGYVFSSAFISDDDAARELVAKNPQMSIDRLRVVPFETRRIRRPWVDNVVAIGNSNGFVEPLEATNLALISVMVERLANLLGPHAQQDEHRRALFNKTVRELWDSTRDFLALHYAFNARLDSPFWLDARSSTPMGDLHDLVDAYRALGPSLGLSNLIPPGSPYPLDAYLVHLVGMGVPSAADGLNSGHADWVERRRRIDLQVERLMGYQRAEEPPADESQSWPSRAASL